jgi:hypothetical protein
MGQLTSLTGEIDQAALRDIGRALRAEFTQAARTCCNSNPTMARSRSCTPSRCGPS